MKCVILGQNATILAKAIHSFARIGDELFLEASSNGLSLRTVNQTKSAFTKILFHLDFFATFIVNSAANMDPFENRCKLSMKSCIGVFRNMKQVESCTMMLDTQSYKLVVQFKCRLQTTKTHHISILEQEALEAANITDKFANVLVGSHILFSNIVSNFKINEEELSIRAYKRKIVAQNYVEGSLVDRRFVRSQIILKPDEFENYKITEETTITFCMRELRAILNFAESLNTSVAANFETGGKPVVFVIKNFDTFEANLIMATLSPEEEKLLMFTETSQQINTSVSDISIAHKEKSMASNDKNSTRNTSSVSSAIRKRTHLGTQPNSNSSNCFEFGISKDAALEILRKKRKTIADERRETCADLPSMGNLPIPNVSEKSPPSLPPPPNNDLNTDDIQVVFQDESEELSLIGNKNNNDDDDSLLSALMLPPMDKSGVQSNTNHAQQEDRQRKANGGGRDHRPFVRKVFKRCFNGSTDPSISYGQVLAECSDEEE